MNLTERKKRGLQFYCPLCHQLQGTNSIEKIQLKHIFQIAIASLAFTIVFWPITEWKGLVSFLFFWAMFELFYRVRKRNALVCRKCGFDPFLYEVDKKLARQAVRKFWEDKIEKEGLFQGVKLKNYQTKAKTPAKDVRPA